MRIFQRDYKAADGTKRTSKVWWCSFTVGGQRVYESTGTRDRRAAQLVASDKMRRMELKRAGIVDPYGESREMPLSQHLADFEKTLRGRGVCERYVKDRMGCLQAFVEHSGARKLADLTLPRASEFLLSIRATGVAARTENRYYQALKQLGIWLVKTRRAQFDPFDGLKPQNEEADRRHVRRALTREEAERLIKATQERPLRYAEGTRIHKGVTPAERLRLTRLGETRALIYLLAMGTGLRKGEIRKLRWCDVDPQRGEITMPASSTKSRRVQRIPVAKDVMRALKANLPDAAKPTDPVIPAGCFPNTLTFHRDLEAAGIERHDETGRVVDFHALRTTFISWLAADGVHPRVAQSLARHASIETTMARYTDLTLLDTKGAVERLPLPSGAAPKKKRGRPVTAPRAWDRTGHVASE